MRPVYLLLLISFAFLFVFKYLPIYGLAIAFTNFNVRDGLLGSEWNNFAYFGRLFNDPFFYRVLFNSIWLSILRIIFAFPAPIIFALLLNEITNTPFKKTVQSVSYFPHFVSWVILGGILREILHVQRGPIALFMDALGMEQINWFAHAPTFRGPLVVTGIWQSLGWGSIVYLAALSSIDPQLYESAELDGAGRLQKAVHITLPSLLPVITIMLLLQVGHLLDESFEQIFNMYNASVYVVADVFDTLIYRAGVEQAQFGYTTAIGLFKNVAGLFVLLTVNSVVRRYSEYGLW